MFTRRMTNRWIAAAPTLLLASSVFAPPCHAQTKAAAPSAAKRYELPVSVTWQDQELAAGLDRLADLQQTAIWLDRRVDPSSTVDLSASNQPLIDVLRNLGKPHDWSATPLAGVVYFGPQQTADELATLAAIARQQVAKAPPTTRNRWLTSEAWSFPRLSQPSELLLALAKSAGASVENADLVPLDLWPARSLPPTPLVDRMVLTLASFDLTCELSKDGRQVAVVPIKRPVQITREFAVPAGRAAAVEEQLRSMPEAKVDRRGQRLIVSARVEELDQLAATVSGRAPFQAANPPSAAAKSARLEDQRFTLRIENKPVGAVIDQLAKQLKLEVTWDAALQAGAKPRRNALISCEVREANVDDLLKATLAPANLAFHRDGQRIAIHAAK
jgi:hypothetical protein